MTLKKTGLILLGVLLILSGCNGRGEPVAVPALARIMVDGTATDIPVDTYGDYIRVRGALSATDSREDLIAIAGLLRDLAGTDYAPDMEQFAVDMKAYIEESVRPDESYMKQLHLVAGVLDITEEVFDILSFDLLSQHLAGLMFDKIWDEMPDDDFIDDTRAEDEQMDAKYDACLDIFYAYLDTLPTRVLPTDDPAVFLIEGETFILDGNPSYYVDYCRYLTHIETIYQIMEITAFVTDMQNYGATYDEAAAGTEADSRIAELYEEASMTAWLEEAFVEIGIAKADFDASYRAMQMLDIRFSGCSEAFAAAYEARPEADADLTESDFYSVLMSRLMEGSEIVTVTVLPEN